MRRSFLYIAAVFFFLLSGGPLSAQKGSRHGSSAKAAAPDIKISVDKQKIVIGEPIQLMLEISVFNQDPLTWPNLDTIPHFEWLSKGTIDSTVQSGGRYYKQYLSLTSFDSGAWAIPQLPFIVGNKKYYSDSAHIEVAMTRLDPNKDYHDIRDIVDIPNPFARYFVWIVAFVALAAVALVVLLIRKRHVLRAILSRKQEARLSPYEEAIRQLDELKKSDLLENGSVKIYYSRLSDIFKGFVYRRMGIASLAETSDELIGQLKRQPLPAEQYEALADTLRMGDFVKFAKYQPDAS